MRARNRWGWGFQDAAITSQQARAAAPALVQLIGFGSTEPEEPVPQESVTLPEPRLRPPPQLGGLCDGSDAARRTHAHGQSYPDLVRSLRGVYEHAPDVVGRPRSERDVEVLLEWASAVDAAVIPWGGGTSVVGGVAPVAPDRFEGVLTLDVSALDALHEVDDVSRAARIAAGASGPRLEEQLAAHGMTLRFFPQSFEMSTLGGWIATRAGGHFATNLTHIDDLVESVRAIGPGGVWASRRVPGSAAGPSPDRLLLGSEGILGIITEAWVRVRPRPVHRAARAVRFATFAQGAQAVRALAQSGLEPANCRLIDPMEAAQAGAGDGSTALLTLGFESDDHPVDAWLQRGLEICREHGGSFDEQGLHPGEQTLAAWREAFLRGPYLRDLLIRLGVLTDTIETAITWERFDSLHEQVTGAIREALGEPCHVTCRLTHVYPDGAAPYFTVLAPARHGDEVAQWHEMKAAAGRAILAAGATITHHHGVGRYHRPWYDAQRPDAFAAALRSAKQALDPAGLLNPGVLVDP
ncbi:MAG: alkyldihydroxyacetonephosphate synthase [Solirubrobacteraceae bacterium]|jgi:alkyldihydroxyacetonephosphate synthase|nr:alkyldihydroxyacetonephosphate synthase [Solirubrobacteraceae bacterium]